MIKKLSEQFGVKESEVDRIVKSQFEFVKSEMAKGVVGDESTFKTILLKYFGTFTFNKSRHRKIGYMKEAYEERQRTIQSEE